jgi:hypothetical protein
LLLLLGVYLLLGQFFDMPDGFGLLFIGVFLILLRIALWRAYGLTIAGCIVIAVFLNEVVDSTGVLRLLRLDFLQDSAFFILLALAFFVIHIAEYRHIGNWPIVPGLCLLAVAVVITLRGRYIVDLWRLWPLVLVCIGASMLFGGVKRRAGRLEEAEEDKEDEEDEEEENEQ